MTLKSKRLQWKLDRGELTFEDLAGLRARGYIRESTKDQADGFSPHVQKQAQVRFAQEHGIIPPRDPEGFYVDLITGTSTLKRTDFHRAIRDAEAGLYDVLLVFHTSRFARSRRDAVKYKDRLAQAGIIIVFVQQGIISQNRRSKLEEGLHELIDEKYSDDLSMWVASGLRAKWESGRHVGDFPMGYRRSRRTGKISVVEREAKVVRRIFEVYATGSYSSESLARHLNGLRDNQGRPFYTVAGRRFTKASIEEILTNDFYIGVETYPRGRPDEDKRSNAHVAVISSELWSRVQEIRASHLRRVGLSAKKRRAYCLSGVARCTYCGSRYRGEGLKRGKYLYLRHGGDVCCEHYGRLRALSPLEAQLAYLFERIILPADWRAQVLRAARKFANPETQQEMNDESVRLQAALQRAKQMYLWGDLDEIEYRREKVKLEIALKQLGGQTLEPDMLIPRLESGVELMKSVRTLWEAAGVTQETKTQFVRELFEEVKLGVEGIVSVRPRPEYVPLFACAEYVNGRGERI